MPPLRRPRGSRGGAKTSPAAPFIGVRGDVPAVLRMAAELVVLPRRLSSPVGCAGMLPRVVPISRACPALPRCPCGQTGMILLYSVR